MAGRWFLGIDLGGGSTRALLLDPTTGAHRVARRPASVVPGAGGGIGFEVDFDDLRRQLAEACAEVLEAAGAAGSDVEALAVSSMRFGTALVDGAGEVLFAVPNRDARAFGEALRLQQALGEDLLRETGHWMLPVHLLPRLLWLREHRPEVLRRAAAALSLGDAVAAWLTGRAATDPTQANASGLFRLADGTWRAEALEGFGLPPSLLPEVLPAGAVLGPLAEGPARCLSLARGTPVVVGGADTRCGLLGAGAVSGGDAGVVAGTTAPVEAVVDGPRVDERGRMRGGPHLVPGLFVLESNAGALGEALTFMARLLHPESAEPELRLFAEAALSPPGAGGILSSVGADIANDRGARMPVGQIALSHLTGREGAQARRDLARAVVEGHACGLRANLEQIASLTGARYPAIALGGGLSRSDVFARILAAVAGTEVRLAAAPETSAFGAALLAAVGSGRFAGPAEAARALAAPRRVVTPSSEEIEAGERVYTSWRAVREAAEEQVLPAAAAAVTPFVLEGARARAGTAAPIRFRPRILVTAAFDEASLARLREVAEVRYESFRERMRLLTGASLVEALAGTHVFVTEVDVLDRAALEALPELRVVAACRGNAVNVDVAACTAFGVPVLYAPGRNAESVADLALAFMLALVRHLPEATAFLRDPAVTAGNLGMMGKAFRRFEGAELGQLTVGLVGFGAVGRAVARRLEGFGSRILVSDPFVSEEAAALHGASRVALDELLERSDIVSLHAAVTDETRGLLGAAELARMRPGAWLVNTARAALVDEEALLAALEAGQLAGAALDTFSVEPPGADHPLVQHPRVISTPHIGGNTRHVAVHQGRIVTDAILALLRGERPRAVLNPEALDGFSWTGPRREPSAEELARLGSGPGPAVTDLERDAAGRGARGAGSAGPEEPAPTLDEGTRAQLQRLLEAFTRALAADRGVRDKSAGKDVALHFELTDAGLGFHLRLCDGTVGAGLGPPAEGPRVDLALRSEVLDGIFTGRRNAMEAALEGDLSFRGDAARAMALQELQPDLERLYRAARERVGAPASAGGGAG